MPLMICPKCRKFHYVPGLCPAPKAVSAAASPLAPGAPGAMLSGLVPTKRGGPEWQEPQTVQPAKAAKKSRAKATKANPRDDALMASEADGVASRLSAGRTAQGSPVKAVSAATGLVEKAVSEAKRRGRPISPNPKSPRAEYQRDLMRKLRAKDKPNGQKTDTD